MVTTVPPCNAGERGRPIGVVLIAACLALGGCTSQPTARNLILIVVDTLRADHLSANGSQVPTPNIDSLAARGVSFRYAYSHIPVTGPSHASIFTGLLPNDNQVLVNAQTLSEDHQTLAESLQSHGYSTAGFVSLGVLSRKLGFGQGFDTFDDSFPRQWFRPAGEINHAVFSWLNQGVKEPFFLWVHYSDPHEPYTPPEVSYPQVDVKVGAKRVKSLACNGYGNPIELDITSKQLQVDIVAPERQVPGSPPLLKLRGLRCEGPQARGLTVRLGNGWLQAPGSKPVFEQVTGLPASVIIERPDSQDRSFVFQLSCHEPLSIKQVRERYAREVIYVDRQIGLLIRALRRYGVWDDSVVIFTSDHGEGLGDHDLIGHIEQLYDSLLRVPLIVVAPGRLAAGKQVNEPVRLTDILPTVHDLLGLGSPGTIRGTSLRSLASDSANTLNHLVLAMTYQPEAAWDRKGLLLDRYKLIVTDKEQTTLRELYDLDQDPQELTNLAAKESDRVEQMQELLDAHLDLRLGAVEHGPVDATLSDEERARLEALGYLRGH
jgi:arylsulfatase A-like enzyme